MFAVLLFLRQHPPSNITVFNWDSFSKKEENVCVIEDARLSSPYRMLRPEDIARLCDSCRRLFLRDVDVRANQHRDSRLSVDYGKTPIAIMQCVTFVRRQLRMKETILVRAKDVFMHYRHAVKLSGEMRFACQN